MNQTNPTKVQQFDRSRTINRTDLLLALLFAIYALLFFLGRWGGSLPFVSLGSDLAINVAGSAAAADHPDAFRGDPVLGDAGNFQYYLSAQIPLAQILVKGGLDYGMAVILPLGFLVFLHLLGYYTLGRVLFKNRFWAFLLAVFTIFTVILNSGEFWGVYGDPYPRLAFQAVIPFLLAAVFQRGSRLSTQICVMAGCGLLMYVHSISALTWAVALWLGFWLLHPKDWSWKKRVLTMVGCGGLFLLVSAPFWMNYLGSTGAPVQNVPEILRFMVSIYPAYLYPFQDFAYFLEILRFDGLLLPGLAGLLLTCCFPGERRNLGLMGVWFAGLIFAVLLVPALEISLRLPRAQIPVLPILVRGERYLVLFLEIFWLYPLAVIERNLRQKNGPVWRNSWLNRLGSILDKKALRVGIILLGIGVVALAEVLVGSGYQSGRTDHDDYPVKALRCWSQGKFVCPAEADRQAIQMLQAVRNEIPAGKAILPMFSKETNAAPIDLAVRYSGLHPVVYTEKDFSTYWQSAPGLLLDWERTSKEVRAILSVSPPEDRLAQSAGLARRLGADYLIVDWKDLPPRDDGSLVYQNKTYQIYALAEMGK